MSTAIASAIASLQLDSTKIICYTKIGANEWEGRYGGRKVELRRLPPPPPSLAVAAGASTTPTVSTNPAVNNNNTTIVNNSITDEAFQQQFILNQQTLLLEQRDKKIPFFPNVFGTCISDNHILVVQEHSDLGTLQQCLENEDLKWSWLNVFKVAFGIVSCIEAATKQGKQVVKIPTNFLIDKNWNVKIQLPLNLSSMEEPRYWQRKFKMYFPPEYVRISNNTSREKMDIYCVGMLIWAMANRTSQQRFVDTLPINLWEYMHFRRWRPAIPKGTPGKLAIIMQQCWHHNPDLRFSLMQLQQELQNALYIPWAPSVHHIWPAVVRHEIQFLALIFFSKKSTIVAKLSPELMMSILRCYASLPWH